MNKFDISLATRTTQVFVVNGKEFLTEAEAYTARDNIGLDAWVEDIGLCREGEWSEDMVVRALVENAEQVFAALKDIMLGKEKANG